MSTKKVFYLMIVLLVLVVGGGIGSIAVGNIVLQKKANELVSLKLDNKVLDAQQVALVKANKDIQKYADLESIAKAVVPKDKDQARAVREIVQIASQSGITLTSVSFPASNLGAGASSSASGSGTTSSKVAISQATPVSGLPGVYSLEMIITPETTTHKISYTQFLDFLSRLENNRRTAQVTSIKIDPVSSDQKSPYVTFSLTINIFIKP
ncbi:MAG: hypothetical protein JWS12_128 [Candidatus Saccharibacteria bacterium]|nr:hypothetical protein [Candidatus Saccharibacteria bacterium]